jgi:tetratricopeptide (TPR) repeat protein
MSSHHFRDALGLAQRARAREPGVLRSYSVLVDAQIELGRYGAARRSLERMIAARPDLASYARVSFFRELHGDLGGAEQAIRLAISAGGDAPENVAYVQGLLGHIQAVRGRRGDARAAFREALAGRPDYVPALAGLARLDAGAGDLPSALRLQRRVVRLQALPEHVVTLGELEQLAGNEGARPRALRRAAADDVAHRIQRGHRARPARGRPGRPGTRAARRAPGLRSRAERALRRRTRLGAHAGRQPCRRAALGPARDQAGSRDPLFLARAGLSAEAAGRPAEARRLLRRSIEHDARFSAVWSPRVRAALRRLARPSSAV